MDIPLISVIVTVYNTELYLPKCIESILSQIYTNFELILVDDGSIDKSGMLCDQYALQDRRIRVVHEENLGAIKARDTGLELSHGAYISFVDSDDWIESDMLSTLVMPIIYNADIDISVSPHSRNDGGTENTVFSVRSSEIWSSRDAICYMYQNKWFSWTLCGKLYRKCLFEGIKIKYSGNAYGEDIEWNAKLFKKSRKISYQPYFLYHYFQHPKSMVHQFGNIKRLICIDRMKDVLDSYINIDARIVAVVAKLICTTGVYNLLDVLQYGDLVTENEIQKYQDIIREASFMMQEAMPASSKRCFDYSQMNLSAFRDKYHDLLKQNVQECKNFCDEHEIVFIYGAGKIADEIALIMEQNDLSFEGFVVSQNICGIHRNKNIRSYKIVLNEYGNSCGFILGLNEDNKNQVVKNLKNESVALLDSGKFSLYY